MLTKAQFVQQIGSIFSTQNQSDWDESKMGDSARMAGDDRCAAHVTLRRGGIVRYGDGEDEAVKIAFNLAEQCGWALGAYTDEEDSEEKRAKEAMRYAARMLWITHPEGVDLPTNQGEGIAVPDTYEGFEATVCELYKQGFVHIE